MSNGRRRLAGKAVIVTGATRGMGEAIARGVTEMGGGVILCGRDALAGARIADELGDAALYLPLDVADEAAWPAVVAAGLDRFGTVTGLVNNAGLGIGKTMAEMATAEIMQLIAVNQLGVWHGMRAVAPAMRAAGGGSIVNIGSAAGIRAHAGVVAYSGTKAAVVGMSLSAAAELAPDNIRVNVIHPGFFDTRLLDESSHGRGREMGVKRTPLGRVAQPGEIVGATTFLLSDESAFVTGAQLTVDGGLTM